MKPIFIHSKRQSYKGKFISLSDITYSIGDKLAPKHNWEMVDQHNSVHVLVNNTDTNELLLVKQPRVPVVAKNPDIQATIECCAGIIDQYEGMPLFEQTQHIARDEVQQELGYSIPAEQFQSTGSLLSSVGSAGSTAYTFYVEVTAANYTGQDLGEHESIEPYPIPYNQITTFLSSDLPTDAITKLMVSQFYMEQSS